MKVGHSRVRASALLAFLFIAGMSQSWSQGSGAMRGSISSDMSLEQIEQAVRAALPPRTTLTDIDRYFTENHIEHGYYKNMGQVLAMVPNVKGGFFPVDKSAQIIITLDESENLASTEVKAVLTGP